MSLRSLFSSIGFLSREECQALFARIVALSRGGGGTYLSVASQRIGASKWARSRMVVSSDINLHTVNVGRIISGAESGATATRIDDDGLRDTIRRAELSLTYSSENPERRDETFQDQPILQPVLWSEQTYGTDVGARTKQTQEMMAPSDAAGFLSAGDLSLAAQGYAVINSTGLFRYYPVTEVECSMTVRDVKGTASGWAGINHYDLAKVDSAAIAARAFDKCKRSANPVAIEPGRYVAILEPQATADLFGSVVDSLDRENAERGRGPFTNGVDLTKIGEQVMDARLMLKADPMEADSGFLPFDKESGEAYRPVTWIDRGVLRELSYGRGYARSNFGTDLGLPNSRSYTLAPAPDVAVASVDQMVAMTKRGILVTRFWGVTVVDGGSLMSTGYTRDGLWLIEDGKIKSSIKNFRFTDSPLFALNNLEQIGAPVRVFRPGTATLAPPVRVRDFNFTGLADAV